VVGVGWDEQKNPLSLSGMRERRWEVWFSPPCPIYHRLCSVYSKFAWVITFVKSLTLFFLNINSINTPIHAPNGWPTPLQPHLHNQPLSHPLLNPHPPDPHQGFSSPHTLIIPPFSSSSSSSSSPSSLLHLQHFPIQHSTPFPPCFSSPPLIASLPPVPSRHPRLSLSSPS